MHGLSSTKYREKMLNNISKLEFKVNQKVYQILCDIDSPLGDFKEALFQATKFVGLIEDNIKAQQEQLAKEMESKEPPKEESPKPEGEDGNKQ